MEGGAPPQQARAASARRSLLFSRVHCIVAERERGAVTKIKIEHGEQNTERGSFYASFLLSFFPRWFTYVCMYVHSTAPNIHLAGLAWPYKNAR